MHKTYLVEALLRKQIEGWVEHAKIKDVIGLVKVLIVPHAGYRYSGATAAHCYKLLGRQQPKKIILLGPSHHSHLRSGLWGSSFHAATTPFGSLRIGNYPEIDYSVLDEMTDRREHSLELQFPFIKFCCPDAEILPYLIGSYSKNSFSQVAAMLRETLGQRDTVMVVSSDFCHYGYNYGFYPDLQTYTGKTVSEKIKALDMDAIDRIFAGDPERLVEYFERTRNTICGRNAILLAMMCIRSCVFRGQWTLLDYEQSSQIIADSDKSSSSVSYIAATFTEIEGQQWDCGN